MFRQGFGVGKEEALAEHILPPVEQMIDGKKTEVAHSLVVGVGKNQGDGQPPPPGFDLAPRFAGQQLPGLVDQFTGHRLPVPASGRVK